MSSKEEVNGSGVSHPGASSPSEEHKTGLAEPADRNTAELRGQAEHKQADQPETDEALASGGGLTTGEMARLSHNTLRTVRFYESEGLIAADNRQDGSRRRFSQAELQRLLAITDLRESGLSLQSIKDLMALKAGCPSAMQAARTMGASLCEQIAALDQRIGTMQRVRAELSTMLNALEPCRDCTHPDYPVRCRDCPSVTAAGGERPTLLLWRH